MTGAAHYCPHCPHCQRLKHAEKEVKAREAGEPVFIHHVGFLSRFTGYDKPKPARAVRGRTRLTVYPGRGASPIYCSLKEWDEGNGTAPAGKTVNDAWVSRSGSKEFVEAVWVALVRSRGEAAKGRLRERGYRFSGTPEDIAKLRRTVQDTHPDRGGNAEDFRKAKQRLDAARGRYA